MSATILHPIPSNRSPVDLPFDILEHLLLHADKPTLRAFSLTSQAFVAPTRGLLFELVSFEGARDARRFDIFLDLLGSPHTTIPSAVKTLSIAHMIYRSGGYKIRSRNNVAELAEKLSQLKSFELINVSGSLILPSTLEFISHLPATDVVLDTVFFYEESVLFSLLQHLPVKMQRLTFINMRYEHIPEGKSMKEYPGLVENLSHLVAVDTRSLEIFCDPWARSEVFKLGIAIKTFHLRLCSVLFEDTSLSQAFFSDFLSDAGHTMEKLCIDLSHSEFNKDALPLYSGINLSGCRNLSSICIGMNVHLHRIKCTEDYEPMWSVLSVVPAKKVTTVTIVFEFSRTGPLEGITIDDYPWVDTVERLRKYFPAIKMLTFRVRSKAADPALLAAIGDKIRKEGLPDVDVVLEVYWLESVVSKRWRIPWKELSR